NGTGQTTGEQKRTHTLSNGEVIWDLAGNVWEWTNGTAAAYSQPGAAGYAWRQWNSISGDNGLTYNPFPVYANGDASDWSSAQNIGPLYSSNIEPIEKMIRRGGDRAGSTASGVYSTNMSSSATIYFDVVGFRAAS
ncbi:hypothetical protein B7Y94_05650, partial [Candidatus Saccharibacteria bacterium 32-49-12]